MPSAPPARRSDCPAAYALDLFGDRWTLLVVRDLMFKGKRRYGEFLAAGEGIATNILAERLARLEAAGVIAASPDPERRGARRYHLTDKGIDLAPLLVEMMLWSARHDAESGVSRAFVRRASRDREKFLAELRARLRAAASD